MVNPQQRFTNRVEYYRLYRPGYPAALYEFMQEKLFMTGGSIAAEIGSGTGMFAEDLLKLGMTVYCVEPNPEMRKLAEQTLQPYAGFRSVDSSAEKVPLEDHFCDFVIAAQSFHWFDRAAAKKEFTRILKPDGFCLLIWNDRKEPSAGFLRDYEKFLLKYGIDYEKVNHKNIDHARLVEFFAPQAMSSDVFENYQEFDFPGLTGRVLSCSYMPDESHAVYGEMILALKILFETYKTAGKVRLDYDTRVYYSKLSSSL